jgi:hypothetical protein
LVGAQAAEQPLQPRGGGHQGTSAFSTGAPGSPTVATATAVTATAVAATANVTTAATAATTTTAALTGGGLVDPDHPAHPLHILEIVDGFLFGGVIGQFNEGETALAPGFPIEGQAALTYLPVLAEEIKQVLAFGLEREITDVNGHSLKKSGTDSFDVGCSEKAIERRGPEIEALREVEPVGSKPPGSAGGSLNALESGQAYI